jgi:hypothetical protein
MGSRLTMQKGVIIGEEYENLICIEMEGNTQRSPKSHLRRL